MPLTQGDQLGPYEILSPIGEGGMGQVWKARDTRLDRTVAIKISQERYSERFEREARAIAALNHPHICTLFDVGADYLVMEYLEGKALRGPLPVATALQYGAQCADALQCAHAKGVVHRDFKPANILITKAGVKLLDFGLARVAAQAAASDATATIAEPLTKENSILGTLQYMAPEQLEGKPADSRSDIFAFGLVLYEAISGKPAFPATSQASLIAAVLKDEPPSLSALQPVTPAALDRVVRKCLAKDPDARWQSAADLRDELLWIAQTSAVSAPSVPAAPSRPSMRKWTVALALVLGLGAGMLWQFWRTPAASQWVATRLGGPASAMGPQISPDGQLIAFQTMVDHLTQVAVMKADGSSWTVLTTQRDAGYVVDLSWSPDGSKLYFSRYFDQPRGVYEIPVLGGEPRLIVENAMAANPLPDGSLIVARLAGQGDYQLARFWPESGRNEPLPAFLDRNLTIPPVTVFPDGREAAFIGVYSTASNQAGEHGLYALDLATRKARRLGRDLDFPAGIGGVICAAPDSKSLLVMAPAEDLFQVVKVQRNGASRHEVLFSMPSTIRPYYLSAARDGSVFLDALARPVALLRFTAAGGDPEETVLPDWSYVTAPLPGGKSLLWRQIAGKNLLLTMQPGGDARPFLQTSEESKGPNSVSAGGSIAFVLGTPPKERIAVAQMREGRIVRQLKVKAADVRALALSPDAQTLYYASGGAIWSVPVSESSAPRRIVEGDDVTIDPAGRFLYVKQMAKDPAALVRVSANGGPAEPIAIPGDLRLTTDLFSAGAVDAQGRLVIETASPDSYFYSTAVYDPTRKSFTRIPVKFEGDIWTPGWTSDGRISARGARLFSSLWRYHLR